MHLIDMIIPFGLGVAIGLFTYSSGWRAQSPFYKEPK